MSDEQNGLIVEKIKHHSTEDGQCDVWVDGCERVVEQVYVTVTVDGPCQTHSLSLTTAQRHAAVTDQRRVTVRQSRQVHVQAARLNRRSVPVRQTTLCQYVSCSSQLRSATTGTLLLLRAQTSTGQRRFAAFGPATWNSLPPSLRTPELSLNTFKRRLKTQLFQHP